MKKITILLFGLFILSCLAKAQNLDKIGAITLQKGTPPDSISFILTISDFNYLRGKPIRFLSSLQIIDADKPWPPRWFVTAPLDSMPGERPERATPLINASTQNGKMVFYASIVAKNKSGRIGRELAYLICDKELNITDSFGFSDKEIDSHDFKISPTGEKLYFVGKDTIADITGVYNNPADTAVKLHYEIIQIADAGGKVIFNWNPILNLGIKSTYAPYRKEQSVISNRPDLDWSHGNSLNWDKDGNILYSLKYIGIGKISRRDGHVIWRVDRNKLRPTPLSDSLPMFMQHDFQPVENTKNEELYSVLSNGDGEFPICRAYQFTVHDSANYGPIIRLVTTAVSDKPMQVSGGGNYDVEANGNYLINFGIYGINDTATSKTLFEYHAPDNRLLGLYYMPGASMCYRVHKFSALRPERPIVQVKKGWLLADKGLKDYKWYKLSGPELKTVTPEGTGPKLKLVEKGFYCLTVKQGIGASVSNVVEVK